MPDNQSRGHRLEHSMTIDPWILGYLRLYIEQTIGYGLRVSSGESMNATVCAQGDSVSGNLRLHIFCVDIRLIETSMST
jgi:hypothetical protein